MRERVRVAVRPAHPFAAAMPAVGANCRAQSSNAEFAAFVEATGHVTDAERFGWSFVHKGMLSEATLAGVTQQVAGVPWWLPA